MIKAIDDIVYRIINTFLGRYIIRINLFRYRIYGDESRLHLSQEANVLNALFNVVSGNINIEKGVFFGHNVCLLTGTHNYLSSGASRRKDVPSTGRDITVKQGAWLASNVTVLGPCIIGENAVVAANSLVIHNVQANTLVAGTPARIIKYLKNR